MLDIFLKHIRISKGINLSSHSKSGLERDAYAKVYRRLTKKAEETKIELSDHLKVEVSIANLLSDYNLELTVTRDDFEAASEILLEKIQREIRLTLEASKINPLNIDKVVLVGGSALIPAIRNFVEDIFETPPFADKPLDKLVAMGAAIAVDEQNAIQIRDLISHSLGIEIKGKRFSPILKKNTIYPTSQSKIYRTVFDYQESAQINVYEGENIEELEKNHLYGGFELLEIERALAGVPQIKVIFEFDKNRILHVTAQDLNTKSSRKEKISIDKTSSKPIQL